jgi:hypothetical protein
MTEEHDSLSDDQSINDIVTRLKLAVDQLGKDFVKAEDLIHELARHLDESNQCERNQVSRKIKEILKDKIREGKITAKWIEDCLSPEYKRKYTTKSEVTSLSKENRKEIEVGAQGNSVVEQAAIPSSDSDNNDTTNNERSANEGANYTGEFPTDNALELESKSNEGNQLQSQEPKSELNARALNLDHVDRFFDTEFELPFEALCDRLRTLLRRNNRIKSIPLIAKVDLVTKSLTDIRIWKEDGTYDSLN